MDCIFDIDILEINEPYPIRCATRLVQDSRSTFLLVVQKEANHIEDFLTEIHDKVIEDDLIMAIHGGAIRYKMIYKGRCRSLSHCFLLETFKSL